MVDSASEARLRAEARAKSTASAKTRETKTDAQKDAELGISRGRTDSAASVDERTQAKAKTLTPDQLAARQAQAEAADALAAAKQVNIDLAKQLGTKVDPNTGKIIPKGATGGVITGGGTTGGGTTGGGTTGGGTTGGGTGGSTGKTYTAPDGRIFTDLAAYNAYIAQTAAEEKRRKGQSAYDLLFAEFDRYGMGGLLNDVKKFIQDGLSKDELTLKLRATPAYEKRFAANAQRINKGFRAISEAEYIGLEDQYQNVMRQYGLPESYYTRGDMGRQEGFEKFIAGDVSAVELEDRIQTAQNRVINANPEVSKALREFYPDITGGDILAYALDPDKAITNIKRKVQAAEIGAGAMQAGLQTGLARAEELQRYGVTKETAQQGFGTIASGLERGRQLSNIYQQPTYTQEVAETEVFALPDAEKARRQRRRLGQLETATFSGSTGITGGALDRERAGQY
jgi:hypothetical protein